MKTLYLKIYKPLWKTIFFTGIVIGMVFFIPFSYYANVRDYYRPMNRIINKNYTWMVNGE